MTIISFLVQLAGATMLLLFAVRMVRTGIERAFGPSFQRAVVRTQSPVTAASTGVILAIVLQSSAAVALLVAGFAGTGSITFATGLAMVLGADLGSALLIQILSFKLEWLVPVLLAIGGGFFIKSDSRKIKQAGRIILGIAFILISLRFLRETMDPIRDSAFLPSIASYLEKDFVTAFIAGAGLAVLMHSSVAVILMCVTLVSIAAIPVDAGVSLILGANLGSAIIPTWLTRGMSATSRRVPMANLALRGTGAIIALFAINRLPILPYLAGMGAAQTLVNVHIIFNLILLLALPFCKALTGPFERYFPNGASHQEDVLNSNVCVLDNSLLDKPQLALANLKREVLRMAQVVDVMMRPMMDIYHTYDKTTASAIRTQDEIVNKALDDIRLYTASMDSDALRKPDRKLARDLTEYAIAVETAGDIIVKRLLPLAKEKSDKRIKFSAAGREELVKIHERVMSNMSLAFNVLVSDDLESARLLLEEKSEMTRMERKSRKRHLQRLSEGTQTSFESSDIHLETVSALREFNSHIAAVAYPILYRGGQLLETRLIQGMDKEQAEMDG
ncbi:MAG: Na/Pi cotransporter family protein [Paracoccaceae bacterium]